MQQVVYQMKLDDIEENPDSEFEMFDCSCCAKSACLAGSIQYSKYRLCNDCVLMYESALKLNKVKNIEEFMQITEEKRLENLCDFIKKDKLKEDN
jgi:hypothetical protein